MMRLPLPWVVLGLLVGACTDFPNEPARAITVQPVGWATLAVTDVETLAVNVQVVSASTPITGLRVKWQSSDDALLTVVQTQSLDGASREDTLVAQLRAVATAHAGGLATVSVFIEGGGAFEADTVSDTIRVTQKWVSVSAGYEHSCGVTVDSMAYCWGSGFLGSGSAVGSLIPVRLNGDLKLRSVSAGDGHTCGVLSDGTAYCWGVNDFGQIGNGTQLPALSPAPVSLGRTFESLAAGAGYVCGLSGGIALCWGTDLLGQLGAAGLNHNVDPPAPVPPFDNCAPLTGNVRCSKTPRQVETVLREPLPLSAVAPGEGHTCGLLSGGEGVCWGDPGKLGSSTLTPSDSAVAVPGGLTFRTIASGALHTCAITSGDSTAFCWGFDHLGQLGTGALGDGICEGLPCASQPTRVSGTLRFRTVSAGGFTTCGITSDSSAYCWGSNEAGQLGNDTASAMSTCDGVSCSRTPVKVQIADAPRFVSLDVGASHTCGATSRGAAYCWGGGAGGRLGHGASPARSGPVRVSEPVR